MRAEEVQREKLKQLGYKDEYIEELVNKYIANYIYEFAEAYHAELLNIDSVIVPKGTLCLNCNKETANRGIGETKTVCSKCWNSMFKHNAL